MIKDLYSRIPAAWRLPLLAVLSVLILLLIWFYGARASNSIGSWWFQRGVNQSQKEIQQYRELAAETLKELEKEKQVTAAERAKRELAEKILADKTLNANEKLKAYEDALQKPLPVSPVGSTSDLCERARQLGVFCE